MKILQKTACYNIIANDSYICAIGKSISIYDKKSLKLIYKFTGFRYCFYAKFSDESTLVVKNTFGVFNIYDLKKGVCIRTIKNDELSKTSHDSKFIISPDNKNIYDVLANKIFTDVRLYKINIENHVYDSIKIGEDVRVVNNISFYENKVFFMQDKAIGEVNNELCELTIITQVDLMNMQYINIFEKITTISNDSLLFFDNRYILFENMDVIDIMNNSVVRRINYPYKRMNYGYFKNVYFSECKKYLFFIFSKRIVVFDYVKDEIAQEYEFEYCSSVQIIGDKILIGTWEKLILLDFKEGNTG